MHRLQVGFESAGAYSYRESYAPLTLMFSTRPVLMRETYHCIDMLVSHSRGGLVFLDWSSEQHLGVQRW